ncbi:MAG: Ig-like domain repeat protein [Candidatus Acidiferrum sp.]|jgi:hypothetical protein
MRVPLRILWPARIAAKKRAGMFRAVSHGLLSVRRAALLLATSACLFSTGTFGQSFVPTVPAQLQQIGSKLVGTGASGNAGQGYELALSADGNTAIVGGVYDNAYVGAVWIFTRSNGVWSQQGGKLAGSDVTGVAEMGYSVAISADGNTVAFGGHNDNVSLGAVWVFTRSNGVWSQQGSKLVGTGATGNGNQGSSVALSGDGNTLAEGGVGDNGDVGAIWVFTRNSGVWTQQGSKLVGSGALGSAENGYEVALSTDGNTLLDGAPYDNDDSYGALWVFTRSAGTWTQQGSKLVPSDINPDDESYFGASIGLSGDGNTAVASAPYDNGDQGGFWIYTRSGGVWTQLGNKINADPSGYEYEGYGLTISRDGSTILEPDPYVGIGGAYVFNYIGGNWIEQSTELVGSGSVGSPKEGYWTALSADGKTALVGGYQDNSAVGAVWAFDTETNYWSANVGSTVTHTIIFTVPYENIFQGITIQTQGSTSLDFSVASSQPQAGACTIGTLYQMGDTCLINVQFTPSTPGLRYGGLVVATKTEGPPYAIVTLQGFGLGPQAGFVSGIINTAAGTGVSGYTGDGGPATSAKLINPVGVGVDALGNFYVADCGNGTVRKVTASTGLISTFAGTGTQGYSGDGDSSGSAQLTCPLDIKVDGAGNVYIADPQSYVVRVVNAATGNIYTVAGNGTYAYSGDGGAAFSASIGAPEAIALDPAGNLYIADTDFCNIRRVDVISGVISTVAGTNTCGYSGDGGPATSALLGHVLALALDSSGNLYISDDSNYVIRVINTTTGIINTFAGTGSAGYSGDGGPAASAAINDAEGLTVDAAGNLYITDSSNNLIRKITVSTGIINRVAGDGTTNPGYSGDGGAATSALLNYPSYPAMDSAGNLYEADESNFVVREINGAAPLAFGSVAVSSTSDPQDITISNNGTAPLSLSSLALSGPFNLGGDDNTCSSSNSLAPGASCIASVVFAPTSSGALSGSLTLGSSTVSFTGTGGAALTATTTALTISPSPANAGLTVTFTATIAPAPSGSPYGTVSFYSDCTLLGTASVNASGVAVFTTSSLAAGTYDVYAVYSGNADSQGSISPWVSLVINTSFTVTAPQTPFMIASRGSVNVTITVPPLGGAFNNLVLMSVTGLPNGAVASFNPASVTPGSAGTTTIMTVQMGSAGLGVPHLPLRRFPVIPLLAALLSAALFLFAKRSRFLRLTLATAALACLVVLFQGCNGGFSGASQGGAFNLTVTGTSGAQHASTTITLVVQR